VAFVITSLEGYTDDEAQEVRKAEINLQNVQDQLEAQGIRFEIRLVVRGLTPRQDLFQFAKNHHADEIIMGIRRRSRVGKFILGSNAQYAIFNASCPVTITK